jgi:hypothetical protein
MPDSHAMLLSGLDWATTVPLPASTEPNRIGLIVSDRSPMPPLAHSVMEIARTLAVSGSALQSS